jgi:hypothetical protein
MKYYIILLLLFFCGCGRKAKSKDIPILFQEEERRTLEGTYRAILRNSDSNKGEALIIIKGDDIYVTIEVDGAPSGKHPQHIHVGGNCSVPGPKLIPLDSDLNSQFEGQNDFPSGDDWSYDEHASVARMTNDLMLPDDSLEDDLEKLESGQDLVLEGALVNIESIQARDNICGALMRVRDEFPRDDRRVEPAPIRVEVSDSIPPQVRPAPGPTPKRPWYRRIINWWRNWWYNLTH